MQVTIQSPKDGKKRIQHGSILVASGTAKDDGPKKQVTGITGTLIDTMPGATDRFVRLKTHIDRKNNMIRWRIVFQPDRNSHFKVGHEYRVEVTEWFGKTKGQPPRTSTFTIDQYKPIKALPKQRPPAGKQWLVGFDYPAGDITISAEEAESFLAYGSVQDAEVTGATLGSFPADFLYETGGNWIAQFPAVTAGATYPLVVSDSQPLDYTLQVTVSPP